MSIECIELYYVVLLLFLFMHMRVFCTVLFFCIDCCTRVHAILFLFFSPLPIFFSRGRQREEKRKRKEEGEKSLRSPLAVGHRRMSTTRTTGGSLFSTTRYFFFLLASSVAHNFFISPSR